MPIPKGICRLLECIFLAMVYSRRCKILLRRVDVLPVAGVSANRFRSEVNNGNTSSFCLVKAQLRNRMFSVFYIEKKQPQNTEQGVQKAQTKAPESSPYFRALLEHTGPDEKGHISPAISTASFHVVFSTETKAVLAGAHAQHWYYLLDPK